MAEPACAAYGFPASSDVRLAVAANATQLRGGSDACGLDPAACTSGAALAKGAELVVTERRGDWACAAHVEGEGLRVGWVRAGDVRRTERPSLRPAVGDWAGRWIHLGGDGEIDIEARGKAAFAKGTATLDASTPTDQGDIRAAALEGSFTPGASSWTAPVGDCRVRFARLGSYLVARDEVPTGSASGCGGDGVTFSGIYKR